MTTYALALHFMLLVFVRASAGRCVSRVGSIWKRKVISVVPSPICPGISAVAKGQLVVLNNRYSERLILGMSMS